MANALQKFHRECVSKFVRALVILIGLLLLTGINAMAQLSPGDLAEVHQELEGLTNCTACHELGEGPSSAKCLECHQAVKRAIDSGRGYHYREVGLKKTVCMKCHSDHAGLDFKLINWPNGQKEFDHTRAGYTLEGTHQTTACRDCHNPANLHDKFLVNDSTTDITRTFLGLDQACLSCHIDEHRGQLNSDCLGCHTMEKFKSAKKFDHAKAKFGLAGKHTSVTCDKCHTTVSNPESVIWADSSYLKFINIPFGRCEDCHKDIHQGKYQKACNDCHSVNGWKQLVGGAFDHSKADYPLLGQHQKQSCEKCHKTSSYLDKIKHEQCLDCHTDIHQAQFATRDDKGKCESCHTVEGFMPSFYSVSDHQKSVFELKGAHLAQPCIVCHKVDSTNWKKPTRLFKMKHDVCTDCHRDVHAGQFATADPIKRCATCHNEQQWGLPEFNHDEQTTYPLVGAHKKSKCVACHKSTTGEAVYTLYRYVGRQCIDCHINPEHLSELGG